MRFVILPPFQVKLFKVRVLLVIVVYADSAVVGSVCTSRLDVHPSDGDGVDGDQVQCAEALSSYLRR